MNVLILSNSKISSGAGVIAKDFEKALKVQDIAVKILVNQFSGKEENTLNMQTASKTRLVSVVRSLVYNKIIATTLLRIILIFSKIFKVSNSYVFKSIHKSKYMVQDVDQTKPIYDSNVLYDKLKDFRPDVIVVLFMQNFINYENLYDLRMHYNRVPICINLLDMASLTGGCHYNWECIGYQKDCSKCPAVPAQFQYKIEKNLKYKTDYAYKGDFNYIYCSEYQKEALVKSKISSNNRHYKIPLPIDECYFNNNSSFREKYRKNFGYDYKDIILFFGAMNITDPRKGGTLLFDIVRRLVENDILSSLKFLIIGSNSQKFQELIPENRLIHLDVIPPSDLPKYYNAADIFLSPSVEDAGPMMVNQSIMCGTRVCSFEIGVALDMVKPNKECGRCSKEIDSDSLYKVIEEEVLYQQENDRSLLRQKCAQAALPLTSKSAISKKWVKTIDTILKEQL